MQAVTKPKPTRLKDIDQQTYRMRMTHSVEETAKHFGITRSAVWRRCQRVEQHARELIEKTPIVNLIVQEIEALADLERQSRELAENATNDRSKLGYLGEARRARIAKQKLMLDTGILPREPTAIYSIVQNLKPTDDKKPARHRSRDELIEDIISEAEKMPIM